MVLVDVVVVSSLVLVFLIGVRNGLCAGLTILAGTIVGGVAAVAIVPPVAAGLPVAAWSGPVMVALAVALLGLGVGTGVVVGGLVRRRLRCTRVRPVEQAFGGLAAVLVGALLMAFTASAIASVAPPAAAAAVGSSRVLQAISALTPPQVGAGMAQLRGAFLDAGMSRWAATVTSPMTAGTIPVDIEDPALRRAAQSVVLIEGVADTCDRAITGSGFAIAPGRFVTNAHVVAGIDLPLVVTAEGHASPGRVVHFDPQLDLAVIAADALSAPPLPLATGLSAGSTAAVQGHPHGERLTTVPARVLWRSLVTVPGVSVGAGAPRDVYALDTDVWPGGSGGPLLAEDGRVAGVIFARGDDGSGIAYATTDAPLRLIAEAAADWTRAVDTGSCAG